MQLVWLLLCITWLDLDIELINFQKPIIPIDLYRGIGDSQLIGLSVTQERCSSNTILTSVHIILVVLDYIFIIINQDYLTCLLYHIFPILMLVMPSILFRVFPVFVIGVGLSTFDKASLSIFNFYVWTLGHYLFLQLKSLCSYLF